MSINKFSHWPPGLPHTIAAPGTSVYINLETSAQRYPERPAIIFYDSVFTYAQVHQDVEALAGYLQHVCGVCRGDRVLLNMQNSPQFIIAYYAIMRADAVVVPVNPMLTSDELHHYIEDSGAKVAIASQEVFTRMALFVGHANFAHAIVTAYSDYIIEETELELPEILQQPYMVPPMRGVASWKQVLASKHIPNLHTAGPDDHACMPYTSGTTGKPKGCIHTHASVMFNAVGSSLWSGLTTPDQVSLAVLPFFHVTGMQIVMNAMIYIGGAIVVLPRWDRDAAGKLITRYKVTAWTVIPTMMIDFLSNPKLDEYDISNLQRVSGGGAAMPAAVAQKLFELTGQTYMEGYGLTETMAVTHYNPPNRMIQQCLGLPYLNVDSRIVDPESLVELPVGESGEIWIHGPQVFQGYWNDQKKSDEAFGELEGKRYFRTGDLGYVDSDGYFYFTDRLKRMINASGYKVWPAEVESVLYHHPGVQECCIIAASDPYRGETVKAVIIKRPGAVCSGDDIITWSKTKMAAYKVPKLIEFVDSLPKSAAGKVMWRTLQEKEMAKQ